MNDRDDPSIDPATGARPLTNMASSLSAIVDRFGPGAFFKPEEVRLLLRQDWPDSNREIDLLLATLADGIPQRMAAAHGDAALRDVLLQSVDRLTGRPSFDPASAMWAVRTWAIALALPVSGFDGTRAVGQTGASAAAGFASVVTPLSGPSGEPRAASPAPRPAMPPAVVSAPPQPSATVARTSAPPAAPTPSGPGAPPEPVPVARPVPAQPAPLTPAADLAATASGAAARRSLPWKSALAAAVTIVVAVGLWFGWRHAAVGPERPAAVATGVTPATSTAPAAPPSTAPASPPSEPANTTASIPTPAAPPSAEPTPVQPAPASAANASANASSEPRPSSPLPPTTPAQTSAASDAASDAAPPTIARIDVPHIASGKPFVVAVSVATGADRVASVERRTGAGGGGRLAPFIVNAVTTLARTPSGALLVPFRAIAAPGPVVIEFALVDRSGVRGPSRHVELEVVAAAPAAPAPPAPPAVARAPCTRATCGSVVAIRPLDASATVELIVRMDDRSIQTIRQSGRWRVGSRVQRIDDRYVPIASE